MTCEFMYEIFLSPSNTLPVLAWFQYISSRFNSYSWGNRGMKCSPGTALLFWPILLFPMKFQINVGILLFQFMLFRSVSLPPPPCSQPEQLPPCCFSSGLVILVFSRWSRSTGFGTYKVPFPKPGAALQMIHKIDFRC